MYENVFHTNYNSFIFLSDVHVLVMIMEMIAKLGFFMFLVTVNETKQKTFGFAVHYYSYHFKENRIRECT